MVVNLNAGGAATWTAPFAALVPGFKNSGGGAYLSVGYLDTAGVSALTATGSIGSADWMMFMTGIRMGRIPGALPVIPSLPAGYVVQAADLNNLSQAAQFLTSKPYARIQDVNGGDTFNSTASTLSLNITANTVGAAGSGQLDNDLMTIFGSSTSITGLQVTTPGWYIFRFGLCGSPSVAMSGVVWAESVTGPNNPLGAGISSARHWATGLSFSGTTLAVCNGGGLWPLYMYAGDYWEVFCQVNTGTLTAAVSGNLGASFFEAEFVSMT